MENNNKKVVIYARVSSDKQDVDLSISAQLKAIREYAGNNGYAVVREFVDEAETGRTTARPAFREMISWPGSPKSLLMLFSSGSIPALPAAGKTPSSIRLCSGKAASM